MKSFEAKHIRLAHTQHLKATPERIFPLLCPTREYDWIEMWQCQMIYSKSGYAEEGCVFSTDFPQDGGQDVWVISRHEPNELIQFVRVNPLRAIKYDISLKDNGDGTTTVLWEQIITALNVEGNKHVSDIKLDDFAKMVTMAEKC